MMSLSEAAKVLSVPESELDAYLGKRVKYVDIEALSDDDIENIRRNTEFSRKYRRVQAKSMARNGWAPAMALSSGRSLWIRGDEYATAPDNSNSIDDLQPATEDEIEEFRRSTYSGRW